MEPSLTAQVLGLLLEKVSRDVPFKESRAFLLGSTPDRVATLLPLAVSKGPGTTDMLSLPPQGTTLPHLAAALGLRAQAHKTQQVLAPKGAHFSFHLAETLPTQLATLKQ